MENEPEVVLQPVNSEIIKNILIEKTGKKLGGTVMRNV